VEGAFVKGSKVAFVIEGAVKQPFTHVSSDLEELCEWTQPLREWIHSAPKSRTENLEETSSVLLGIQKIKQFKN
jgi:hypothetical protein